MSKNKPRSVKPRSVKPESADPQSSRINKVLAAAGLGSRRQVEELIVQGRVEIDGNVVTDLGTRVDPQASRIKVDGVSLKRPKLVYYALNKPKGVLSTNRDPSGRPRVVDFVPDRHRVFSVGRLDLHSEGLVLLTNDGSLAQRLAHPRFRVQKTYFVVVAGVMTLEELNQLRKGVYLAEGVARIDGARIRKTRKSCTELEIQLSEGKNREIRRILARAGHKVVLLRRISIGPLRLGELPVGAARELTQNEVQSLYQSTMPPKKPKAISGKGKDTGLAAGSKRVGGKRAAEDESMVGQDGSLLETGAMHSGSISTPLELPASDDFGFGLDNEIDGDENGLLQEFQFSEESLAALENELEESEDDDWDDDFATDFSSLNSTGSVIGAEKRFAPSEPTGGGRKRQSGQRGTKAAGDSSSRSARAPKSGRSQGSSAKQRPAGKPAAAPSRAVRGFSKKKGSAQSTGSGKPRSGRPASASAGRKSSGNKPVRASRPPGKASGKRTSGKKRSR
jgi:23S rRNA pseudouridine2605 synthase